MSSDAVEPIRALELRCRRELARAAGPHWRGSRSELRGAVRRALRPHRKHRRSLLWVLRNVAANSAFALALVGVDPRPVDAADFVYQLRTGAENPFSVLQGYSGGEEPYLADLDGDGDLDLLVGAYQPLGGFFWWENTGSTTNPVFNEPSFQFPDFGIIVFSHGYRTAASLGDLDSDGDLDMVATNRDGVTVFGENIGSVSSPNFRIAIDGSFEVIPIPGVPNTEFASPALGDVDGDGDFDLLTGDTYGFLYYSENIGTQESYAFIQRTGAQNPFDGLSIFDIGDEGLATPTFVDLDGDGDLDLVVGQYYFGKTFYFENVGTPTGPSFVERTGTENPFDGISVGQHSEPHFGDIDGDGDLDMITNGLPYSEEFIFYERVEISPPTVPMPWWTPLAAAASLLASGWRRLRASSS